MTPSGKIGSEGSDDTGLRGPGSHVFEVENVMVPTGTSVDQSLGSFEIESWAVGASFKLFMELAAPLSVGASMGVFVQDAPDYDDANTFVSASDDGPSSIYWNFATPESTGVFDWLLDIISQSTPTPAVPTIYVVLHGHASGSAPVEVVRARAALQLK